MSDNDEPKVKTAEDGSVTRWIGDLKEGQEHAAQQIWDRYFSSLVRLARGRLSRRSNSSGAEEDVALSVLKSLCLGAARGRFPRLDNRNDLSKLLVVLTTRKAIDLAEAARAQKRGGGRVQFNADLAIDDEGRGVIEDAIGREPTPEFAATIADECRKLLEALGDETLRRIAHWKVEGDTDEEIAARLGCARRTVVRKLDRIRHIWLGTSDTEGSGPPDASG